MVRRSSLIFAASLAVLSTFESGSLCFAAAAPAAQPAEDRFERPRFMKKEIKRFVFVNSTTTHASTTTDDHTTTPISIPDTSIPAEILAASLASVSLASAEASWSAAHPGVPFGSPIPGDSTTSTPAAAGAPTTTPPPAAASTTKAPAASSTQPPPGGNSDTQGGAGGNTQSGQGASVSASSNGGNPPPDTTPTPTSGGGAPASQSLSAGGGSQPGDSAPGGGVLPTPSLSASVSVSVPIESDGSHTPGVPATTGQPTGGQGQPTGGQETGGQPTDGQPTGGQETGGQQTGGQQTTGGPGVGAASSNPAVSPASITAGGVTPGSSPTSPAGGIVVPPASHTDSLIAALSSALAISSPVVGAQSVVNSVGNSLASVASPIIIGSSTNSAGVVVPITASTPAESSAGKPPIVIGSATDSTGGIVPILTASLPGASLPGQSASGGQPPLVSTNSNGQVFTASAPAQSGSVPAGGASESVPVATGSVPAATGSAPPVIIGSSTNSLGQVVPVTGTPPPSQSSGAVPPPVVVGSSTNSLGQVVPVTSAPPAGFTTNSAGAVVPISNPAASASLSNDRFAHDEVLPSATNPGASTGAAPAQTGSVPASIPAPTLGAGQTASPPPGASTAAPEPGASSASAAPLPIATGSQSYNTNQNAPLTQLPTASDSMTAQPVASSIEVASSSPTAVTGTMETGLPSGVPLVLYPPTGPVNRPANTELIQIGFLYPLNYDFVWQHEESQRQIFHYLPIGIAYGLSIDLSNVTMQTLRAWDTTQDLHYITTLALAWIPSNLVDSLGLILHTQAEKFYHNPDPAVRTLLSMINPALPIRADNATDGGPENGVGASPSGTATANGGTIANGLNNSSPVKASSVGIGVGVVCGAAAYGAAMFFVARRYKKRRQSHLRSPSMYSGSAVMSQHGADPAAAAALMSGGMGERSISPYYDNDRGPSRGSGRSGSSAGRQQISAPVMAENSLGWN